MESRAAALRKALSSRPVGKSFASSERAFLTDVFGEAPPGKKKSAAKGAGQRPASRPGTFGNLSMQGRQSQQEAYRVAQVAAVESERLRLQGRGGAAPAPHPIEEHILGPPAPAPPPAEVYTPAPAGGGAAAAEARGPRVTVVLEVETPGVEAAAAGPPAHVAATQPAGPAPGPDEKKENEQGRQPAVPAPGSEKKTQRNKVALAPPTSIAAVGLAKYPPPSSRPRPASSPPPHRDPWMPSSPHALPRPVSPPTAAGRALGRPPPPAFAAWEPRLIDPIVAQKLATASAKSIEARQKIQAGRDQKIQAGRAASRGRGGAGGGAPPDTGGGTAVGARDGAGAARRPPHPPSQEGGAGLARSPHTPSKASGEGCSAGAGLGTAAGASCGAGACGAAAVAPSGAPSGGAPCPPQKCYRGLLRGSALTIHEFILGPRDYPPFTFRLSVAAARGGLPPGIEGPPPVLWVQRERRPNRTFFDWRSATGEVTLLPDAAAIGDGGGVGVGDGGGAGFGVATGDGGGVGVGGAGEVGATVGGVGDGGAGGGGAGGKAVESAGGPGRSKGRVLPGTYYVAIGACSTGHSGLGGVPLVYTLSLHVHGRPGSDPSAPFFCGVGATVGADGSRYQGEHWCGLRNGQGQMTDTDGYVLKGEWRAGEPWNVGGQLRMRCTKNGRRAGEGSAWAVASGGRGGAAPLRGGGAAAAAGGGAAGGVPAGGVTAADDSGRGGGAATASASTTVLAAVYDGLLSSGRRSDPTGGLAYEDGDLLVGEWAEDLFVSGRARHTYPSGAVYEGAWRGGRGVRHGQGVLRLPQAGGELRGEWREDAPWSMNGAAWWPIPGGGGRYAGDWREGQPHGTGTAELDCGSTYQGRWVAGRWHGPGSLTLPTVQGATGPTQSLAGGGPGALKLEAGRPGALNLPASQGAAHPAPPATQGVGGAAGGDVVAEQPMVGGTATAAAAPPPSIYRGVFDGSWAACTVREAEVSPSGELFSGSLRFGLREGEGTLRLQDGSVYAGGFAAEVYSGHGALQTPDGGEYRGGWLAGLRHGAGRERRALPGGATETFEGEWERGERSRGLFIAGDGSQTRGVWVGGMLDEAHPVRRKCELPGGGRWEGEWAGGAPHGSGTLITAGGDRYRGLFERGALREDRHAEVSVRIPGGGVYEGGWLRGQPEGRGQRTLKDGGVLVGSWRGGQPHECRGAMMFEGGHRFEGSIRGGRPEGRGAVRYANGARHEGMLRDGLPNTEGVCVETDGARYEGEWLAGFRHGAGVMSFPGGDRVSGEWARGERVRGSAGGRGGPPAARYSREVVSSRSGASEAELVRMAAVAMTPERLAMGGEAGGIAQLPSGAAPDAATTPAAALPLACPPALPTRVAGSPARSQPQALAHSSVPKAPPGPPAVSSPHGPPAVSSSPGASLPAAGAGASPPLDSVAEGVEAEPEISSAVELEGGAGGGAMEAVGPARGISQGRATSLVSARAEAPTIRDASMSGRPNFARALVLPRSGAAPATAARLQYATVPAGPAAGSLPAAAAVLPKETPRAPVAWPAPPPPTGAGLTGGPAFPPEPRAPSAWGEPHANCAAPRQASATGQRQAGRPVSSLGAGLEAATPELLERAGTLSVEELTRLCLEAVSAR